MLIAAKIYLPAAQREIFAREIKAHHLRATLTHCEVRMSAPLLPREFTTSSTCSIQKLLPCTLSIHPFATRNAQQRRGSSLFAA